MGSDSVPLLKIGDFSKFQLRGNFSSDYAFVNENSD